MKEVTILKKVENCFDGKKITERSIEASTGNFERLSTG